MIDICYYTLVQTHKMYTIPRVNPNINYGLWVIMMCQCRLILGKKCTILGSDVDNVRDYVCVRARGIWEISVPPSQICCKRNTALKNKILKHKQKTK